MTGVLLWIQASSLGGALHDPGDITIALVQTSVSEDAYVMYDYVSLELP